MRGTYQGHGAVALAFSRLAITGALVAPAQILCAAPMAVVGICIGQPFLGMAPLAWASQSWSDALRQWRWAKGSQVQFAHDMTWSQQRRQLPRAHDGLHWLARARMERLGDALGEAAKDAQVTRIAKLLDQGAPVDFDLDGRAGETPLSLAAREASPAARAAVELLLARGAQSLDLALRRAHPDLYPLFLARGARPSARLLIRAATQGDLARVSALLQAGADPNATDPEERVLAHRSWAALHHLAHRAGHVRGPDDLACALALIEHGADPDLPDDEGQTPLRVACAGANERLAVFLAQRSRDPLAPDREGKDALDVALGIAQPNRDSWRECLGMLRALRERRELEPLAKDPAKRPAPRL